MAAALDGATALVTGASSGIGAETARRLASEGATVVLVARRRDRLDEVAAEITEAGGRAIVIESDVSDRGSAEAAVETAVDRTGRLDILVNNAGVMLLARGIADIVTISSTAGRVARPGSSVYNLTKFGVNAFSEALRQELVPQNVRVGVIEPGTVDTELVTHNSSAVREAAERQVATIEALKPADIADAVAYMVTRPRRVAVNELLVRAAEQTW